MSTSQKTFKKGEMLFKDGDKITNVMFIQSGGVNQCLQRGKKNIDLFQLGSNQVLGETALIGVMQQPTGAVATSETKVIEVPVDVLKQQFEGAPPIMKMLMKSLIERLRGATNDVKSVKVSGDSSPCPDEFVPQIFGALYFAGRHKALKDSKAPTVTAEWPLVRAYAQRVMGQSPKRLEQAASILVKLKLARFEYGKLPEDPEGPDVITIIHFDKMDAVESFFEFYQYYLYKPGKGDILKYDDFATQMLEIFVAEGEKQTPDRFGVVSLDFNEVGAVIKEKMTINFSNDHFSRLEAKGVLCKRRNVDGKAKLEFEIREYQHILFAWRLLRELDKWNEKGFVDMNEKEERKAKKTGSSCPQCAAEVIPQAKFCQDCGAKLTGTAAA